MKRKQCMTIGGAMSLVFLLAVTGVAKQGGGQAAGQGGNRGGRGGQEMNGKGGQEMQQFRRQQREVRQKHFRAQQAQNREFRATLKDKAPNEACAEIMAHRKQQFAENTAWRTGQHEAFVAFVTGLMQKNDVPADRQAERLARMTTHWTAMKARHDERDAAVMAKLQELNGKPDLTWAELQQAMQELRPRRGKQGPGDGQGRRGRKKDGSRGQGREQGRGRGRRRELAARMVRRHGRGDMPPYFRVLPA